jgi:predicted ribosome quality control (RQC) complex YloA/Tae2 family protein
MFCTEKRCLEEPMGKVYESLKEVVKLQRSKNDPISLAEVKDTHASSLDEEINALAQRISGLKAAVKHREEEIKKEAQQVIQTLSEDFAMLETKLKDAVETVRGKESVSQKMEERLTAEIHALQNELNTKKETLQSRDKEINDLKSKLHGLTGKIQEMSSFLKQAEALTAFEGQNNSTLTASEPLNGVEEKPTDSPFKVKVPAVPSNEQTNVPQQTVAPDFFDIMSQELAVIIGRQASMIVRKHVAALGESMEKFPKSRLDDLLEILSKEIVNEPLRIGFRVWFVKHGRA